MPDSDYRLKAFAEIKDDWTARKVQKPRPSNIFPAGPESFGAFALKEIRQEACRADLIIHDQSSCQIWKTHWEKAECEPRTNPCTSCRTLGVGLVKLSRELWGLKDGHGQGAGAENVDESDLRAWLNGRKPVPTGRLRTAIFKAYIKGWLNESMSMALMTISFDLEATGIAMRKHLKEYKKTGSQLTLEQLTGSTQKALKNIEQNILAKNAPPDELMNSPSVWYDVLGALRNELLQICSTKGANNC